MKKLLLPLTCTTLLLLCFCVYFPNAISVGFHFNKKNKNIPSSNRYGNVKTNMSNYTQANSVKDSLGKKKANPLHGKEQ